MTATGSRYSLFTSTSASGSRYGARYFVSQKNRLFAKALPLTATHPPCLQMDVLFAAMLSPTVPTQSERARWLKVKEFSDQISLLSSVAIASDRPLSPWEEGRIKDLAAKLLQELQGIESPSAGPSLPEKPAHIRPVTQVSSAPTNEANASFPQLDHNLQFLRQNLFPKPPTTPVKASSQTLPDPSLPKCLQERLSTVPPKRKRGRKAMDKTGFACIECGTTDTPEWRKGPNGKNSLCNACGLRWSKQFKPEKTTSDTVSSSSESAPAPATPTSANNATPLSPRAGSPPLPSSSSASSVGAPSSSPSVSSLAAVASALSIPVTQSASSAPGPSSSINSILN